MPISISDSVCADLICTDQHSRDNPYLASWFVRLATKLTEDPHHISLLMKRTRMQEAVMGGIYRTCKAYSQFTRFTNILYIKPEDSSAVLVLAIANYSPQTPLICYLLFDSDSKRGLLSASQRVLSDPNHRVTLQRIFERLLNPWIKNGGVINDADIVGLNSSNQIKIYWDTSTIRHFGHYVMNDLSFAIRLYQHFTHFAPSFILARIENGFLNMEIERSIISQSLHEFSQLQCFCNRMELLRISRSCGAAVISLFDATVTAGLADAVQCSLLLNSEALESSEDGYRHTKLHGSAHEYDLIIGVGLRGGTREALNLDELLETLQEELVKRGLRVCYLFDGLCESINNIVSTTKDLSLEYEVSLASSISTILCRNGAECFSVVGLSLISQLRSLSYCDFMIAHQGSSSAKYSYLLSKPVILHGPVPLNRPRNSISICPVGLDFIAGYRGSQAPPEMLLPPECILIANERLNHSSLKRQELFRINYTIDIDQALPIILSVVHSAQFDKYPLFDSSTI